MPIFAINRKDPLSLLRLSDKRVHRVIHVLVWITLFIFPSILLYQEERDNIFLIFNYIQTVLYFIVFYINYLWLIPRLFFRNRKVLYLACAAALIFTSILLMEITDRQFFRSHRLEKTGAGPPPLPPALDPSKPRPPGRPGDGPAKGWPVYNFILITGLITGVSLGIRFSEKLVRNEKMRKEAEKEKLNTQLALLRNQINPHFLFNTLNSIYGLALTRSEQTADAVMKLSDMMRYVIQDVNQDRISLASELEYIRQYVELQKLRLSRNVEVNFSIEGDPESLGIAPMMLIPFIENAFKFGTTAHGEAVIGLMVKIYGAILSFSAINQIFEGRPQNETFGIGVSNTRQRLQMIYPGRHILEITENGKTYRVNLTIDLS